eukprot:1291478-Amphidinium_carterae.1
MNPDVKRAYVKNALFPLITRLGPRESKARSKILSRVLRHGARNFPTNNSGRYSSCDIWSVFRREFDSPQLLVAMTIPLGNDKQRFHWSVSSGTVDWRDYPGGFNQLANLKVA